ncbi:Glyco_trans_2-like domain-containing protein [Durusdinium trenchii]|uniref:Glyco_trans_2-like domain-containing protein n=1 Tax=Durusdinium trenchii TaxID=1381693 RepID=A0ABP0PDC1_9DINO
MNNIHPRRTSEALQQIAMQDYPGPLEVIVMDDSPRAEEASQFSQELDIRYFHVDRCTIGEKRNMAVAEATRSGAEMICIWDDDDIFTVDRLRQQVSRMVARPASCSSIQVAFVAVLTSGILQRCKGLPLPFENSFCFRRSWLEGRPFSNTSLGEGNVIFEELDDWYAEAQPISGEELPFLYVRTQSSTAPDDALEPYPVKSMLIGGQNPRVDVSLLALARAFRRERFPELPAKALEIARGALRRVMQEDLEKMRKDINSTSQLAPVYWDALNLEKAWAFGGGVPEGSLNHALSAKVDVPEENDVADSDGLIIETDVAMRLIAKALSDF